MDVAEDGGEFLADGRRLRQIVFNLLSNAFKFTPRGGEVTLTGRVVGEDVQITVADNGPGLAPDVKANVFERFSAGKSRAGARAGAGLGPGAGQPLPGNCMTAGSRSKAAMAAAPWCAAHLRYRAASRRATNHPHESEDKWRRRPICRSRIPPAPGKV